MTVEIGFYKRNDLPAPQDDFLLLGTIEDISEAEVTKITGEQGSRLVRFSLFPFGTPNGMQPMQQDGSLSAPEEYFERFFAPIISQEK